MLCHSRKFLRTFDAPTAAGFRDSGNRINHVLNDDVQCAMPLEIEAPPQGPLFL
jgi:hypothetical protein